MPAGGVWVQVPRPVAPVDVIEAAAWATRHPYSEHFRHLGTPSIWRRTVRHVRAREPSGVGRIHRQIRHMRWSRGPGLLSALPGGSPKRNFTSLGQLRASPIPRPRASPSISITARLECWRYFAYVDGARYLLPYLKSAADLTIDRFQYQIAQILSAATAAAYGLDHGLRSAGITVQNKEKSGGQHGFGHIDLEVLDRCRLSLFVLFLAEEFREPSSELLTQRM